MDFHKKNNKNRIVQICYKLTKNLLVFVIKQVLLRCTNIKIRQYFIIYPNHIQHGVIQIS